MHSSSGSSSLLKVVIKDGRCMWRLIFLVFEPLPLQNVCIRYCTLSITQHSPHTECVPQLRLSAECPLVFVTCYLAHLGVSPCFATVPFDISSSVYCLIKS